MEDETTRELAALQRERELLLAREKENTDALDEVLYARSSLPQASAAHAPLSRAAVDLAQYTDCGILRRGHRKTI